MEQKHPGRRRARQKDRPEARHLSRGIPAHRRVRAARAHPCAGATRCAAADDGDRSCLDRTADLDLGVEADRDVATAQSRDQKRGNQQIEEGGARKTGHDSTTIPGLSEFKVNKLFSGRTAIPPTWPATTTPPARRELPPAGGDRPHPPAKLRPCQTAVRIWRSLAAALPRDRCPICAPR